MDLQKLNSFFNEEYNIYDFNIENYSVYKDKTYSEIISCKIEINKKDYKIIVCIPINWKLELFDIFLDENEDMIFIPHIDPTRKFCVYNLDGVLLDNNFYGLLFEYIRKVKFILDEGINLKNLNDFTKEFSIYLSYSKNLLYLYGNFDKNEFGCINDKVCINKDTPHELFYNINLGSKINNIDSYYFEVNAKDYILPPDFRNKINKTYFNNISQYLKISSKNIKKVVSYQQSKMFIFKIKQPNNITNLIGFYIKNPRINYNKYIQLSDFDELYPIFVYRIDSTFLLNRMSYERNDMKDKKILLIGCGSIGGYVFNNLLKSGNTNITLVDYDTFDFENIYRHLLGKNYVRLNKAEALKKYAEVSLLETKISIYKNKIEDLLNSKKIDLEYFDYIVSTIGNPNINRYINQYIYENKIVTPIFYLWNEVLDVGSHVAYIKYGNKGCYNCLFRYDDNDRLYDITSYVKNGQRLLVEYNGCSGSYIPYGNSSSIKTALLFIELLKYILNKGLDENILISQKGEDYYLKKANIETSKLYNEQEDIYSYITGTDFVYDSCEVCSNDN